MADGYVIVKALKPRERKFVDEYMLSFLAQPAAVLAGYNPKDTSAGCRLLRMTHIVDEIRYRCLQAQARLEVTGDDIRRFLASVMWDPRPADQGGPTHSERIMAARELATLMGLRIEKHMHAGATLADMLAMVDRAEAQQPVATVPALTQLQ